MIRIVIIPIGEADQNTLESIARALREIYGSETVIYPVRWVGHWRYPRVRACPVHGRSIHRR